MRRLAPTAAFAATAWLAACGPNVNLFDASTGDRDADAAVEPCTVVPMLGAVSSPVPYSVATVRGSASGARRVFVEGGAHPVATDVLPDGTFCVDVPIEQPSTNQFTVSAQCASGAIASRTTMTTVTGDPTAGHVPGAHTCSGSDPAGCSGTNEICGNGTDDDCNGLIDAADPACAACSDDALEPNDTPAAPRIEPGSYMNLQICPDNADYYGVQAAAGQSIHATIMYAYSAGHDLDLQLLGTDGVMVLATSASTTSTDAVTYAVTTGGVYLVHVFGFSGSSNAYSMTVTVTTP